jgi:sugar phosphate isomerase/epimerase
MGPLEIDRRTFLKASVMGALATAGQTGSLAAADSVGKPPAGKIGDFKISLAEWSLHRALFRKELDNLDFPRVAREVYGIEGIEFVNQFFKDKAKDLAYLKDLKGRANDHGVTCVLIMIDGEGDLSAKEKEARNKAIENHKKWVDAATALGCHSIRINTGNNYSSENVFTVADACGALVEYAERQGINIVCENHGGPSSNPDALLSLISWVGKDRFGTLPDFGNFERDRHGRYLIDIYRAIDRMIPFAKGVSAKSYDFDAQGHETTLDYARILKIVTDSGYHGFVGIEYEGKRLSEPDGIRATKRLLESLRGAMYTPSA